MHKYNFEYEWKIDGACIADIECEVLFTLEEESDPVIEEVTLIGYLPRGENGETRYIEVLPPMWLEKKIIKHLTTNELERMTEYVCG